jgi:hypothetical protein
VIVLLIASLLLFFAFGRVCGLSGIDSVFGDNPLISLAPYHLPWTSTSMLTLGPGMIRMSS